MTRMDQKNLTMENHLMVGEEGEKSEHEYKKTILTQILRMFKS